MKNKFGKRVLSLLLSALMVVTSVPLVAMTASAATSTTLFHYAFNSGSGTYADSTSTNTLSDYGNWGSRTPYDDYYRFTNGYMAGDLNSNIRSGTYNKNWKIVFDFAVNNTEDRDTERILSFATAKDATPYFGIATNGNITINGTTTDSKYAFATDTRYTLTYAYHDGIINVLVNDVIKYSAAVNDRSQFESINSIYIGGMSDIGAGIDCYDLIGTSYQDNSAVSSHLTGRYFTTSKLTDNAAGKVKAEKINDGATWDAAKGAKFDGNQANYMRVKTDNLLSKASETTGFTFVFQGTPQTCDWRRFFDYSNGAMYGSGACNYAFIASRGTAELKYNNSTATDRINDKVDTTSGATNEWALVVLEGGYKLYKDNNLVGTVANSNINADWFADMIENAYINFGASSYTADSAYDGYLKDFRIYNAALTADQLRSVHDDDGVDSYVESGNTYNTNYSSGYTSAVNSNLVARFDFENGLDGVDGNGNTIAVTSKKGDIGTGASGYPSWGNVANITPMNDAPLGTADDMYSYGAYIEANTNPFAGKDLSNGATITFWHTQFHYKDDTKNHYDYNPVVTFYKDGTHYVSFTYGGYILYADGASNGSGYYRDYKTSQATDIVDVPYDSTTVTAQTNNIYTHYGFTISNTDVSIYVDGVKYTYSVTDGDTVDSWNPVHKSYDGIPAYILDFIKDSNTKFTYGNFKSFTQPAYVCSIDDVRLYNKALTQVELRSIYGENDTMEIYNYAEGHDPTIVNNVNYGKSGHDGEYKYYMFGTAMTIYGSNDMANWTELADSQGRTGYQNEEYWGRANGTTANYQVILREDTTNGYQAPLVYSGTSANGQGLKTGNGKMVWAPSVYYNTTNNKYMMVCSTSGWGSTLSCIFTAEADSIEGPYYNITPILYSGFSNDTHGNTNVDAYSKYSNYEKGYAVFWEQYNTESWPNCIDACPFYGPDGNLYMSYGSWGSGIYMVKLNNDGKSIDSEGNKAYGDVYYGVKIASPTTEELGSGSGEGSFCHVVNGVTYLNVSYGSVHKYQYTMRVWRNTNSCPMAGYFNDVTGSDNPYDTPTSGAKLMGNYSLTGSGLQYYDNGHCSYITVPNESKYGNEAGKTFLAYHTRIDGTTLTERAATSTNHLNEARVHQVVYNRDGWECVMPYQYSGETFNTSIKYADGSGTALTLDAISGTYAVLAHGSEMTTDFKTAESYTLKVTGVTNGTISGDVVSDAGEVRGSFELDSSNYITFKDTGGSVLDKGVMLMQQNEQGSEKLVFSVVSVTDGSQSWGIQMSKASSTAEWTNPDADLSIDPIVYVHGDYANYNPAAFNYGTTIADGTNSQVYDCAPCNISIANGWSIDTITNADGNSVGETYSVTNGKLSGTVKKDPKNTNGYELALNITYHNNAAPSVQYVETVYTWVLPTVVPAHTLVVANYNAKKNTDNNKDEASQVAIVMKLQDSVGEATWSGNTSSDATDSSAYGVGNYRSVNDLKSKSGWTGEVNNGSGDLTKGMYTSGFDIAAGSYSIRYDTNCAYYVDRTRNINDATEAAETIGKYYLDASSDHNPEGTTITKNGNNYNWTLTAQIAATATYQGTYNRQVITSASASGVNWNVPSLSEVTNKTSVSNNSDSTPLLKALYTEGQGAMPESVYNSTISGTGTVTSASVQITENDTYSWKAAGATMKNNVNGTAKIQPVVYVCDKSITRNAIAAATGNDIESNKNYTKETYDKYLEALRVANAFVNNTRYMPTNTNDYDFGTQNITVTLSNDITYTITTSQVLRAGETIYTAPSTNSKTQETFGQWINQEYNDLFNVSLYEEFREEYEEFSTLLANIVDYTEESYTEMLSYLGSSTVRDYSTYAEFVDTVDTEEGEISWRIISNDEDEINKTNYGEDTSTSYTAKENYEIAKYELEVALSHLRKKADTADLKSEYTDNASDFANGIYTDLDGDDAYSLDTDAQNYTVSSWEPFASAYSTVKTMIESTDSYNANWADYFNTDYYINGDGQTKKYVDSLSYYAPTTKTFTNPVTGATTTVYNVDNEAALSTYQQDMNNAVTAIKTASQSLETPADYSSYDAAIEVLRYQDLGVFTSAYLNGGSSIFDTLRNSGTRYDSISYSMGIGSAQVVNTPSYSAAANHHDIPYVVYDGGIYKDVAYADQSTGLDAITAQILSIINDANDGTANANVYTVTYRTYLDGVQQGSDEVRNVAYGSNWSRSAAQGSNVLRWVIQTQNVKDKTIAGAQSYSFNVYGDTVISLYLSSKAEGTAGDSDTIVIYVDDNNHNIVNTVSVGADTTIGLGADGSYTLAGTAYSVVSVPFMTFNGWTANGKSMGAGNYTAGDLADENYTVTLHPKYLYSDNAKTATYNITLDGTVIYTVSKDRKVDITNSGYALAFKAGDAYYVASYDASYTYFAEGNADFVTITKSGSTYYANGAELDSTAYKELYRTLDNRYPSVFSVGHINSDEGAFYTYSASTSGVTVNEVGTIYAQNNGAWTDSSFVIGASGVYKVKASDTDLDQYYLKIRTTKSVVTRGYVKYTFHDAATDTDISTIVYGNIVNNG